MQGDEQEPAKTKKDRKGKKKDGKKKKDRSKKGKGKGKKKDSRKKRKETEALEEGFLEVVNHQPEYLTRDITPTVTEPTTATPTANLTTELIPEMPTHEPDTLPATSPEDDTVSLGAVTVSTQTEVEVDCKHCPSGPIPLSSSPTDLNTF